MSKKFLNYVLASSMALSVVAGPAKAKAEQVERPPQYVLLAFDGSYRNSMWQYLREFSKKQKENGVDNRFTFFINPVYLLYSENKKIYNPPGYHMSSHGMTKNIGSAIGWGDDQQDISDRLDNMNGAFEEGHELGSHAVGHWDGSKWSADEWKYEFQQFFYILDNVFALNKIKERALEFRDSIVGFRAPLLGYSKGLYQELPEFGIKYDTSQQDNGMEYWPRQRKDSKIWNFPLANVHIPGTAKHYPTMDYNFCANDTLELLRKDPTLLKYTVKVNGKTKGNSADCLSYVPDETKQFIKGRMFEAYMNYFNNNYYGNRAPVSIGHHFSPWMSGAYFEAMMDIASAVCSKPEVKCVTYHELMGYMETKTPSEITAFANGNFEKLPRPKAAHADEPLDVKMNLSMADDTVTAKVTGQDARRAGLQTRILVDGKVVGTKSVSMDKIREAAKGRNVMVSAVVSDRFGTEIQSSSHRVTAVGTDKEKFETQSIEDRLQAGHMAEADVKDASDATLGH
jgi:peptidoglycan/xylan/chitin deacetylase (PgdA/CDA1 family)